MTTIDITTLECPYCKSAIKTTMIQSWNTFGAEFYSDGKMVGSCVPQDDTIGICSNCNKFVWKYEMKEISSNDSMPIRLEELRLKDYIRALDDADLSDISKEYHIRMQIRWAFNDRVRQGLGSIYETFAVEKEKEIYEDNLKKLLKLSQDKEKKVGDIKKTDGEDNNINDLYIMQAEFFRELGQFDESIKILNKITNDNERKDKLLKACQEKNSNLIKFEREKINSVD